VKPLSSLASLIVLAGPSFAADWPQWRGPKLDGASPAKDLPVKWSTSEAVWQTPLPGRSGATPAKVGDRLFVSTPDGGDLYLYCLSSTTGEVQWKRKIGAGNRNLGFNSKNNFATPSPMADGEHVWILVGSGDIACFTHDGKEVWRRNLAEAHGPFTQDFGIGSSPLLWKDQIIFGCFHRKAESWILALDKKSGEDNWKVMRPTDAEGESRDAYTTPTVFVHPDGREELVVTAGDLATAHNLKDGAELWRHADLNLQGRRDYRFVFSPVCTPEFVVIGSCKGGPMYAVRPGGKGDVTNSDRRVWTRTRQTPDVPTPAHADGYLYVPNMQGGLACIDAKTGEEQWLERLVAGAIFASPVVADGKIYVVSERGKVVVLKAGPMFEKLAENDMEDDVLSTPVADDGRLYFRTSKRLVCIGAKK
jgi:outer membrane protein assembly factor BamB